MAADFTAWDRTTLEQFAREATAKLIENTLAIEELVGVMYLILPFVEDAEMDDGYKPGKASNAVCVIRAAITKHESTTKEQHSA